MEGAKKSRDLKTLQFCYLANEMSHPHTMYDEDGGFIGTKVTKGLSP